MGGIAFNLDFHFVARQATSRPKSSLRSLVRSTCSKSAFNLIIQNALKDIRAAMEAYCFSCSGLCVDESCNLELRVLARRNVNTDKFINSKNSYISFHSWFFLVLFSRSLNVLAYVCVCTENNNRVASLKALKNYKVKPWCFTSPRK